MITIKSLHKQFKSISEYEIMLILKRLGIRMKQGRGGTNIPEEDIYRLFKELKTITRLKKQGIRLRKDGVIWYKKNLYDQKRQEEYMNGVDINDDEFDDDIEEDFSEEAPDMDFSDDEEDLDIMLEEFDEDDYDEDEEED